MQHSLLQWTSVLALSALAFPGFAQTDTKDGEELRLSTVEVISGSQVDLTESYAGGQVARGGRNGIFGNLDFLDTPYSGTAYTEELIRNQQSTSIGDVLQNDPVVRVAKGFGNFQELYIIRGFPVYSDDMTFNGVYGILPRQFVAAEFVERVEVFKGANALINGAAPGGSAVGGAVNLVPKRALKDDLTTLNFGIQGDGQLYGAGDISRRFGANDQFGLRSNLAVRSGKTGIDDEDQELTVFSIGTDYRSDRFRFNADLGYQTNHIDAPRPQVTPYGAAPSAPDADVNYAQPWTYTDEEQLFGVLRGEFDITTNTSVWLGLGARNGKEKNVLANPSSDASGLTSAYRFDNAREDDVLSIDTGLRTDFATGFIDHRLTFSGAATSSKSKNAYAFSNFAGFANSLYSPFNVSAPAADFFVGGSLDAPLKTEQSESSSIAIADMMTFFDGKFIATIGARQQWIETKSFDYNSGAELSSYDDSALTPSVGLVYKPTEWLSVFANYSESLQPGSTAPATSGGVVVLNAGEILDPYRSEQYEIGLKFDKETYGGTISVFDLSKPNPVVVNQIYSASGEQAVQGLEASIFGEPTEGLRIIGGLTLLNAELEKTQSGVNQGNTPIGIADIQFNANVEWDVPVVSGLTFDARLLYTGDQYIDEANSNSIDSWARLDLGARYLTQVAGYDVTFRGRIENFTDESYWASAGGYPGANYLVQGGPRTIIVSASVSF